MKTMSDQQAYAAMFHFLEQKNKCTPSDALGNLLGDMSLLPDGSPADPAITSEWKDSVELALKGRVDGRMRLT